MVNTDDSAKHQVLQIAPRLSNAEMAQQLAARGWYVFPCRERPGEKYKTKRGEEVTPEPKTPYWNKVDLPNGKDNATTDPALIKRWWMRWPGALVGIYCEKSGLFAVDIDVKNGVDGAQAWNDLVNKHAGGQAPECGPLQTTPSGGWHMLFELPEGVKIPNNAGKLAPGIDLRSNGYICTGALADGTSYQWQPDHGPEAPLVQAPAWLLDLIKKMTERERAGQEQAQQREGTDPATYWYNHYLPLAHNGNRNNTLYDMGLQLSWSRVLLSEAEELALDFASETGLSESEALRTMKSAYEAPEREPATLPGDNKPTAAAESPTAQPTQAAQEKQETSDPWQAFTLADAYQERPPVEYIAAGMFALPSLNIVYGAPGTLKSFILADLMVCAAGGEAWLTPAPWIDGNQAKGIKTKKAPVMWVDFDNGRRRTHDRFAALGRARKLPPETELVYYSMPYPWLDANNQQSIAALAARMIAKGIKLLVVDNLGVVTGDCEENSGDMASVMSGFRQLAEDTGAAVVLIHHQRKGNGLASRAGDSLRGHSSIEAALDLALLVEREDYSDTVTIKATKTRGEDVLPFSAAFTYEKNEAGELSTARFFGIATEDNKSNNAIEHAVLTALIEADRPLNKTNLVKAARELLPDVGINRVRDVIDRLAALEKIKATPGKNNTERLYAA